MNAESVRIAMLAWFEKSSVGRDVDFASSATQSDGL